MDVILPSPGDTKQKLCCIDKCQKFSSIRNFASLKGKTWRVKRELQTIYQRGDALKICTMHYNEDLRQSKINTKTKLSETDEALIASDQDSQNSLEPREDTALSLLQESRTSTVQCTTMIETKNIEPTKAATPSRKRKRVVVKPTFSRDDTSADIPPELIGESRQEKAASDETLTRRRGPRATDQRSASNSQFLLENYPSNEFVVDWDEVNKQRFVPNVTITYNLAMEPCLKYQLCLVQHREFYYRTLDCVVYLESFCARYELSRLEHNKFCWSSIVSPDTHTLGFLTETRIPLEDKYVRVIETDLSWNEIVWGKNSLTIRGTEYRVEKIQVVQRTASLSRNAVKT
ncbi:RFX2 [Acrasis kona]|uniref:RFX2 n=1 Tax=Acrasis kona TaxID=1008807 RepID=A0AAW2Z5B4_9EUKA